MATVNCTRSYSCALQAISWTTTWADLYDAATGVLHEDWEPRAGYMYVGPVVEYNRLDRSVLVFDTSSVPANATITSATLKGRWIYEWISIHSELEDWLRFVDAPAANVPSVAADFLYLRDCATLLADVLYVYPPRGAWRAFSISLNAAGLAAINKGGSTIIGLRSHYDTATPPALNTVAGGIIDFDAPDDVYLEVVYQFDPPDVTTLAGSSVEETTATENGEITDVGCENADERGFDWGTDISYGNSWTELGDFGVGAFSHPVTGLTPGTTIHFRAKAHNPTGGWGYGSDLTFTTKPEACTNMAATGVSDTQIDVSWTKGTGAVNTVVRRKEGSYPTDVTDGVEAYNGPSASFSDTGLTPNTTYYYRGWSYTDPHYADNYCQDTGTTQAAPPVITPPTVTTESANTIDQTNSTTNGVLTDDGGEACDCWFEYGLPGGTIYTTAIQSKTTGELFSQALSGLTPDTRYHFRAIARNSQATTYGANMYFVTESPALTEQSLMPPELLLLLQR